MHTCASKHPNTTQASRCCLLQTAAAAPLVPSSPDDSSSTASTQTIHLLGAQSPASSTITRYHSPFSTTTPSTALSPQHPAGLPLAPSTCTCAALSPQHPAGPTPSTSSSTCTCVALPPQPSSAPPPQTPPDNPSAPDAEYQDDIQHYLYLQDLLHTQPCAEPAPQHEISEDMKQELLLWLLQLTAAWQVGEQVVLGHQPCPVPRNLGKAH